MNRWIDPRWFQLTTSLKILSGIFLEELQTALAEEWENITGASLTAKVSREVWIELWDKSTIIPSRFISSTTVWKIDLKGLMFIIRPLGGNAVCFDSDCLSADALGVSIDIDIVAQVKRCSESKQMFGPSRDVIHSTLSTRYKIIMIV